MNRLSNLWNRVFPLPKVKDEAAAQLAQAQLDLLYAHSLFDTDVAQAC